MNLARMLKRVQISSSRLLSSCMSPDDEEPLAAAAPARAHAWRYDMS